MSAYSGALQRALRTRAPSPPGVDQRHFLVNPPDNDPFQSPPSPDVPMVGAVDIWAPTDPPGHTGVNDEPIHHWDSGRSPAVPSNIHPDMVLQLRQERMMRDHGRLNYRAYSSRPFRSAGAWRVAGYLDAREPGVSGITAPQEIAYMLDGHVPYDQVNPVTEVYSAEPSGRYRMGARLTRFAGYEFWTKQGQDAELRAHEGLHPAAPVTKPQRRTGLAPYTAPSTGTDTWTTPSWNDLRQWSIPSETALSDYMALQTSDETPSDFLGDTRL